MNEIAPFDTRVDPSVLAARLSDERAPDIVEALNEEAPEVAAAILLGLPMERAVEVLDQPELDCAADIIEMLPRDRVAGYLSGMSADRVTDVFREIEEPGRSDLRARLDAETRGAVDRLSAYGEETVGSLMTTEFVTVPGTWTVGQTLEHIRHVEKTRETIYAIFVLDPRTRALTKAVPLRRLISGDPSDNVLSVAPGRRPLAVSPTASREEAARLISKYDLLALPVVDAVGHVIGIVTVDDMIDAMIEKQTQDVQRFGGMEALPEPYMDIGFFTMIRKRAGWLCALFLSADAHRLGHAGLRGGVGEGDRPDAVHPADHEFGRQFRLAGDLAADPGARPSPDPPARLVAGCAAGAAHRHRPRRHPRRHRGHPDRRRGRSSASTITASTGRWSQRRWARRWSGS